MGEPQAVLRGAQIGALRQQARRHGHINGGQFEISERFLHLRQRSGRTAQQNRQGDFMLLALVFKVVAAAFQNAQILLGLGHVEAGSAAGLVSGTGDCENLPGIAEIGAIQGLLVSHIDQVEVAGDDVADQRKARGKQVFGAGFLAPAGIILRQPQFAPQIDLIADAQTGAVV